MGKIKLQKIVENLLDKLRKLYMNGTFIQKFLAFLKLQQIVGNFCFSEQIFHRKQSLGAPEHFFCSARDRRSIAPTMLNLFQHCWGHARTLRMVSFKFTMSYGLYPHSIPHDVLQVPTLLGVPRSYCILSVRTMHHVLLRPLARSALQTASSLLACERQTFLLAKRPSAAMSEEKCLPFAGYQPVFFFRFYSKGSARVCER